jgi:hypothetical protein
MARKIVDITGQRFDMLTVVEFVGLTKHKAEWLCQCDCGSTKVIKGVDLRRGNSGSCGCRTLKKTVERSTTHGATKGGHFLGAYRSWRSMKQRCDCPSNGSYDRYGAIGIRYCEAWADFEAFYADMGDRPEGFSLDRIDPRLGYSTENCRWIPNNEQAKNQRKTVRVVLDGEQMIQADAARRLEVHPAQILQWRRRPDLMPSTLNNRLQFEARTA